jgi:hypothetical protein
MALVGTDVSEERIASIFRAKGISELGTPLVDTFHPDDGGGAFLQNIGSY